ncbi:hypothetical protein QR685DRAFT_568113 [Neurospora intermedia]|uniref:Uncharacterized protein n=1 Tax=Neurospora intermedia TaxID=5142 RepID=A0ABR3DRM5_NEUIN
MRSFGHTQLSILQIGCSRVESVAGTAAQGALRPDAKTGLFGRYSAIHFCLGLARLRSHTDVTGYLSGKNCLVASPVTSGCGRLYGAACRSPPRVWDVFSFFFFLLFAAVSFSSLSRIENGASSEMFVIDIDDKGPPGIQYYGKTRISHPHQTLFNFVSDQDNGVLRQAIVAVDNTTGHRSPVHSAPTSDNCGKPFG